jgi:transketolase
MRSIPGMTVICPADDVEARAAGKAAYEFEGPVYLRFGRSGVPVFHEEGFKFEIGKGEVLQDGTDVAIIATGLMVAEAVEAGKELAEAGISARVINLATIKPLDEELVLKAARETGAIVASEEATIIGGLGSAVAECVAGACPVPVVRHGMNDEFGRSGAAKAVLEEYKLTADGIIESVKKALELKK